MPEYATAFLDDLLPDEAPFEMANQRPERTRLPFVVFISRQAMRARTAG